ncbi:hypothetical protein C8R42DRAFT_727843 [Lentinula raphanica]|nr:hypothetical protein C8R42DRAFT_727843 [Lentinula raphanica]
MHRLVHANVHSVVSLTLEHSPTATIIVTNFTDIVFFLSSTNRRPGPTSKRVSTTPALRSCSGIPLLKSDIGRQLLIRPLPDWDISQEGKEMCSAHIIRSFKVSVWEKTPQSTT